MWPKVKFISFLFCLWPIIAIVVGVLVTPESRRPAVAMTKSEFRASQVAGKQVYVVTGVLLILSVAGSIVMLIDAFTREYEGPKAWPIAIAIMGPLSFGMMSALYYVCWGWMPTKHEGVRDTAFCTRCIAQTLESGLGGVGTHNGVGTRLIGNAQMCDTCGSKIKTLWVVFMLPLVPLKSYRVLPIGTASFTKAAFISRRTKGLYWSQIWPNVLAAVGVVGMIVYLSAKK